jgi:hypothetical protein
VLAVAPAYFDLTSGIACWLYRLARRHAGQTDDRLAFTMKGLRSVRGGIAPTHPPRAAAARLSVRFPRASGPTETEISAITAMQQRLARSPVASGSARTGG